MNIKIPLLFNDSIVCCNLANVILETDWINGRLLDGAGSVCFSCFIFFSIVAAFMCVFVCVCLFE